MLEDCHGDPSRWRHRWGLQVTQVATKNSSWANIYMLVLAASWTRSLLFGIAFFWTKAKYDHPSEPETLNRPQFLFFRKKHRTEGIEEHILSPF